MTRDDIIQMAREAECSETFGADAFAFTVEELERFAALVAEHKREALANHFEHLSGTWFAEDVADEIRARTNA